MLKVKKKKSKVSLTKTELLELSKKGFFKKPKIEMDDFWKEDYSLMNN